MGTMINPYRVILDVLRAREDKRLAKETLYDEKRRCPCAIGAFIPEEVRARTHEKYCAAIPTNDECECEFAFTSPLYKAYCEPLGVSAEVVLAVQVANDTAEVEDSRALYDYMCEWLEDAANEWGRR